MTIRISQKGQEVALRIGGLTTVQNLTWAAIGFGIVARLFQYLHNRTLWTDEAALALTIADRTYAELTSTLGFVTGAPVGFLLLYRFAVGLFGNNEFAIRLVPLLCGIGALLLLYPIAKHYLRPMAVPFAMLLFAASTPLVRYATEGKQYSSDVFISVLLLYLGMQATRSGLAIRWIVPFAIVGALLVWFSYPSVFVLAGIGAVIGIYALAQKDWGKIIRLSLMSAAWLVSFGISYQFAGTDTLISNEGLIEHLDALSRFPPFPPTSLSGLNWLADSFFLLFSNPVGITLSGVAAMAFILGLISMFKRSNFNLLLLASPIIVTFLVSSAQYYPFAERWLLFLVPFMILLIAEGMFFVIDKTWRDYKLIGIVFASVLLFYPVAGQLFHFVVPLGTDELRPVMRYVSMHQQDGDALYVHAGARKAFQYYADGFGFEETDYLIGEILDPDWKSFEGFVTELDQYRGQERVWLFFTNNGSNRQGVNEQSIIIRYLDDIGTRDEVFKVKSAVAYRYNLGAASPAETAALFK